MRSKGGGLRKVLIEEAGSDDSMDEEDEEDANGAAVVPTGKAAAELGRSEADGSSPLFAAALEQWKEGKQVNSSPKEAPPPASAGGLGRTTPRGLRGCGVAGSPPPPAAPGRA